MIYIMDNFSLQNKSLICIAKRNSGKSELIKYLVKNKDKKFEIYFFFYYLQNDLYYWKFDDKIVLRLDNNCNYRGIRKQYAYIPTHLLTKIN